MKYILLLSFSITALFGEFTYSGNMGLNSQVYITAPDEKNKQNFTATQELELKYVKDDFTFYSKFYAQEDSFDLINVDNTTENGRTFGRIDELNLKYDFTNDMLSVGKSIKFWGSLEVRNIVDSFNPQDFRTDMFSSDKLGVYNLTFTHYTDSGEMSLIVKLDEPDQPMANFPYVYYFFPYFVNYDGKLKEDEDNYRPTIYLTYNGSTDTKYALDWAFIYQNGYDSQRYFITPTPENLNPASPTFTNPTQFIQHAYVANKFMTYNTLVVGATLIKVEALYAKVDDNKFIGNYSHIALGLEHTIENIFSSEASLGLISEYYRYDTYEDDKYTDLELFQTMQNDLFVGLRYTLNNANDSSIVGGVIADLEYIEQSYYAKLETRMYDSFKVDLDYYYINPSDKTTLSLPTAYQFLGKHQRVGLNIRWYF